MIGKEQEMTKEEILDQFRDINEAYNNSAMLDTLSDMIDKLLGTQREEIGDIEDFREFAYQKHFDQRISAEHLAVINLVIDLYILQKTRKKGGNRKADDTIPRFDDSIGRMPEL